MTSLSKRYTPPFFPLFLNKLTHFYNHAIPSSINQSGYGLAVLFWKREFLLPLSEIPYKVSLVQLPPSEEG